MHFLEKKSEKLMIGKTNKNDIFEILGPPSTKGFFDEELWIYIEIQTSSTKLSKLGGKKLLKNNILLLDIDNRGILSKSIFFDKDKMNKIKFSKDTFFLQKPIFKYGGYGMNMLFVFFALVYIALVLINLNIL